MDKQKDYIEKNMSKVKIGSCCRNLFVVLALLLCVSLTGCSTLISFKQYESEILDELEWFEFLTTDLAKVSCPGSNSVYYAVVTPRNGGSGIRGNYMGRLKNVIQDEREGYDIYDGLGLLDEKTASFDYNEPKSRLRRVGWVMYSYNQFPIWYVKARTQEEMRNEVIRYLLTGIDDYKLKSPVTCYKETKSDREFDVIEYDYTYKGKLHKGFWYYTVNDSCSMLHYFSKVYKTKNKYVEIANEVSDQIIMSSVLTDDLDEEHHLKYILYSARELVLRMNSDKEHEKSKKDSDGKIITVAFTETGEEKEFNTKRQKITDFSKSRQIMFDELIKLSVKYPDNPKIYYAQAALSEYNASGTRYGEGFDEAKALEYYKKAIAADSRFSFAHYNMGIIYAKNNATDRATDSFKKCVDISPVDIPALYMLGELYEESGDYANAYKNYWKAQDALTYQEKTYHSKLQRRLINKCRIMPKKAGMDQLKKTRHKKIAQSTMANYFSINPEPLIKLITPDYTEMGGNIFSYDDPYVFWHGYIRGVKNKSQISAKWYSPDGKLHKEEHAPEEVHGDMSSYYFLLPVKDTEVAKIIGTWKIDVYFEGELIDTKYFMILDC